MRFLSHPLLIVFQRFPRLVKRAWTREYQDVRLILEQSGDLKYFNIPAGFQRFAARAVLITSAVLLGLIVFLATTSLMLGFSRARLEKSQDRKSTRLNSSH